MGGDDFGKNGRKFASAFDDKDSQFIAKQRLLNETGRMQFDGGVKPANLFARSRHLEIRATLAQGCTSD